MKKLNRVTDSLFFLVWSCTVCYIGWNSAPADRPTTAIFGLFFTTFVAYSVVSSAIRNRKMRQFASAHNLVCTSNSLPRNLALARTSFGMQDYTISNCLHGNLREITVAIFDLSHRSGKSSIKQTVVAFPRTGLHGVSDPPVDAVGSYQFEEAGDWIIAWIPRRTVGIEELEDWCVELHSLARDLLAEDKGESAVRPRLFRWVT